MNRLDGLDAGAGGIDWIASVSAETGMPRRRSGDRRAPKLSSKYQERVAELHHAIKNSRFEELSEEEIASIFGITAEDARTLMTEYDREYPGTRTVRRIKVVRLGRTHARDRDARSGDADT